MLFWSISTPLYWTTSFLILANILFYAILFIWCHKCTKQAAFEYYGMYLKIITSSVSHGGTVKENCLQSFGQVRYRERVIGGYFSCSCCWCVKLQGVQPLLSRPSTKTMFLSTTDTPVILALVWERFCSFHSLLSYLDVVHKIGILLHCILSKTLILQKRLFKRLTMWSKMNY